MGRCNEPGVGDRALLGLLKCIAGRSAAAEEAGSELPILGYTIPYTILNVLMMLSGLVIALRVEE